MGFRCSAEEQAVYARGTGEELLLVSIYVYDLVIVGASRKRSGSSSSEIKHLFKMSDIGTLSYHLGISRLLKQPKGSPSPRAPTSTRSLTIAGI